MKVLHLCADLGIPVLGEKGAAVHVRAMAGALASAGHQVSLVAASLTKSPWRPPVPLAPGIHLRHVPPGRDTSWASGHLRTFADRVRASRGAAGEVRRVLYNEELLAALEHLFAHDPPDFVYERASLLTTAGLAFAGHIGVPHLLELNAPLTDEQRRYRDGGALQELAEASEGWVLRHSDAVLAVSAPLAAHVIALGVTPDRVHVVPNGIDPSMFPTGVRDEEERARLEIGAGPVIGFVGGLRPWHGVAQIPALVDALRDEFPDVCALIVGNGPLEAELTREIDRLGLGRHVRLLGAVAHDAVPGLVRQFDVALAPYSPATGPFYFSPLKVFEYMACSVPVVAAALGQLREVVRDGETGALYQPESPDDLAAACRKLLRSPEDRRRMGAAARARVLAEFTWAGNAARVTSIVRAARPALVGGHA